MDWGVTFFDTAEAYEPFESERISGRSYAGCATTLDNEP
ncbi:hypothetical protein [Actinoplanes sp. NPDC051859]